VLISPVAVSGAPAPAGGNYRTTGTFGSPNLNSSGEIVFQAYLSGGSATNGIFVGTPGSLQAVALQGAAAPAGGNYNLLAPLALNSSGQVAFAASLTGGSSASGFFVGTPGSVQAAALEGTAAPAGGNYSSLYSADSFPLFNASGQVAFFANLTGGSSANGIFAGAPGSVQPVALLGTAAPAGGNYVGLKGGGQALNDLGRVAFVANLTGGSSSQGIFMGAPGALQTAALQGGAAPAGGSYSSFVELELNDSGHVGFLAQLTGSSSTQGIFAGAPGSLQAVALLGGAAPIGGSYSGLAKPPLLNASGQVAFLAYMTGGSSTQGIFAGVPGALQPVALQGGAAPGGNGATYSDFGASLGYLLGGSGQVVFGATLAGTGVTFANNTGLYASLPGGVVEIVRKGDMIDFGNGSGLHTVSGITVTNGSGGEDGRGFSLNDSGMLVYELTFTDGTSGIFTSTIPVPEPSSGLFVFAGMLAAVRVGRRSSR
jgi:hypothetical protein